MRPPPACWLVRHSRNWSNQQTCSAKQIKRPPAFAREMSEFVNLPYLQTLTLDIFSVWTQWRVLTQWFHWDHCARDACGGGLPGCNWTCNGTNSVWWPFPPGGTFSIGETHKSWQRDYLWEQRGSSVELRDLVEIIIIWLMANAKWCVKKSTDVKCNHNNTKNYI